MPQSTQNLAFISIVCGIPTAVLSTTSARMSRQKGSRKQSRWQKVLGLADFLNRTPEPCDIIPVTPESPSSSGVKESVPASILGSLQDNKDISTLSDSLSALGDSRSGTDVSSTPVLETAILVSIKQDKPKMVSIDRSSSAPPPPLDSALEPAERPDSAKVRLLRRHSPENCPFSLMIASTSDQSTSWGLHVSPTSSGSIVNFDASIEPTRRSRAGSDGVVSSDFSEYCHISPSPSDTNEDLSENMRPVAQNLRYGNFQGQQPPQSRTTPLGSGRLQNSNKSGTYSSGIDQTETSCL